MRSSLWRILSRNASRSLVSISAPRKFSIFAWSSCRALPLSCCCPRCCRMVASAFRSTAICSCGRYSETLLSRTLPSVICSHPDSSLWMPSMACVSPAYMSPCHVAKGCTVVGSKETLMISFSAISAATRWRSMSASWERSVAIGEGVSPRSSPLERVLSAEGEGTAWDCCSAFLMRDSAACRANTSCWVSESSEKGKTFGVMSSLWPCSMRVPLSSRRTWSPHGSVTLSVWCSCMSRVSAWASWMVR